jgi:hypothetical protein
MKNGDFTRVWKIVVKDEMAARLGSATGVLRGTLRSCIPFLLDSFQFIQTTAALISILLVLKSLAHFTQI